MIRSWKLPKRKYTREGKKPQKIDERETREEEGQEEEEEEDRSR